MIEHAALLRASAGQIDELRIRIERLYDFPWGSPAQFFDDKQQRDLSRLENPMHVGRRSDPCVTENEAIARLHGLPRLLIMGGAEDGCDSDHSDRRGFTIACMLTGLSWLNIICAMSNCREFGVVEAGRYWRHFMKDQNPKAVGHLYVAGTGNGLVKIGFSTTPIIRAKRLGLPIIHSEPATLLDEWTIHRILKKFQVEVETYRAADVPDFLFRAPRRVAA